MHSSCDVALIADLKRPSQKIFGRCLLERMLVLCERAGCSRFVIIVDNLPREAIIDALGAFRADLRVVLAPSLEDAFANLRGHEGGLLISGDLVFFSSHLRALQTQAAASPDRLAMLPGANASRAGFIAAGPPEWLEQALAGDWRPKSGELLPFAVGGAPADRVEAQRRLAARIREESVARDAPLARAIDRKVSWRLSYPLARTPITPNQITIANSMLGVVSAWLFALPHYWPRLGGALLFVLITTLDGVDGEVARLKLAESEFGAQLDIISDTIVNFVVFVGIFIGCYRIAGNLTYLRLIGLLAGGYGLCAVVYFWAVGSAGAAADGWAQTIDRCTSRDFSYLLLGFALLNLLPAFAWGIAFGSYAFAIILALAVALRRPKLAPSVALTSTKLP